MRISCFRRRTLFALVSAWTVVTVVTYVCLKEETSETSPRRHLKNVNGQHFDDSATSLTLTKHQNDPEESSLTSSSRSKTGPQRLNAKSNLKEPFKEILSNALQEIDDSEGEPKVIEDSDDFRQHLHKEVPDGGSVYYLVEKAQRRSKEYCNPPEGHDLGEEGNVSSEYTLRSVHIVIRHGDRSPMYKLPNQDSPNLRCLLEISDTNTYQHLVESFFDHMKKNGHKIQHSQTFGLYPRQKTCMGAQLTGKGSVQHLVSGDRLRHIYIDKHRLFARHPHQEEIRIKTTDYSRTYQSTMAFLHGLLPNFGLHKLKILVTNNMQFCDEELSGVPCSCPIISRLREFSKKEETRMKSNVTSYLMNAIKREVSDIYGLKTQQVPWIGGIMEVLMGYFCHDLPLPCSRNTRTNGRDKCIQLPLIGKMWQYLDARGGILLSGHAEQKYNLLLVYPLLREIAQTMLNVTKHGRTKLVLYSGHDLTVTPLAKALGIHDGRWPPYASRLIFELYSNNRYQYFIRVLYNGRDKTSQLKFCGEGELQDNLCPLTNFVYFAFHEIFRTFNKPSYKNICDGK